MNNLIYDDIVCLVFVNFSIWILENKHTEDHNPTMSMPSFGIRQGRYILGWTAKQYLNDGISLFQLAAKSPDTVRAMVDYSLVGVSVFHMCSVMVMKLTDPRTSTETNYIVSLTYWVIWCRMGIATWSPPWFSEQRWELGQPNGW